MNWLGRTLNKQSEIDQRSADVRSFLEQIGKLGRADSRALESCCVVMSVNYNRDLVPLLQAIRLTPHYRASTKRLAPEECADTTARQVMIAWIRHCEP